MMKDDAWHASWSWSSMDALSATFTRRARVTSFWAAWLGRAFLDRAAIVPMPQDRA